MSWFLNSTNLVDWHHCYCGNDCLSNCVGMPTFKFFIIVLSICCILILISFMINYNYYKKKYKYGDKF